MRKKLPGNKGGLLEIWRKINGGVLLKGEMSRQEISAKRRRLCQKIINESNKVEWGLITVRAAFMNGNLPHGVALAWTGERDAFLVNLKRKVCKPYVKDGKFLMHRALMPIKIKVNRPEINKTISDSERQEFCPRCCGVGPFHNQFCQKLRPVAQRECPACVNDEIEGAPVRGLTHNQFCDSLKIDDRLESEYDKFIRKDQHEDIFD